MEELKVYVVMMRTFNSDGDIGLSDILCCCRSIDDARAFCEAQCLIDRMRYGLVTTNPYENHYESRYPNGDCDCYDINESDVR